MESIRQIREKEEKRPQSEYRKNIRCVDNEPVRRDAEYGGYRVNRKDKIAHLDRDQYEQEESSGPDTILNYEKTIFVVVFRDAYVACREPDDRTFVWLKIIIGSAKH